MHVNTNIVNNATFAKYLKDGAGYTVGMFGKYVVFFARPYVDHVRLNIQSLTYISLLQVPEQCS